MPLLFKLLFKRSYYMHIIHIRSHCNRANHITITVFLIYYLIHFILSKCSALSLNSLFWSKICTVQLLMKLDSCLIKLLYHEIAWFRYHESWSIQQFTPFAYLSINEYFWKPVVIPMSVTCFPNKQIHIHSKFKDQWSG